MAADDSTWNTPGTIGGDIFVASGYGITQNVALPSFPFPMFNASGTPLPGLAVTATVSLGGAAFVPCTNPVTEIGDGFYSINLAAADSERRHGGIAVRGCRRPDQLSIDHHATIRLSITMIILYPGLQSPMLPLGLLQLYAAGAYVNYVDPRQCVLAETDTDDGEIDPRQAVLVN